MSNRLVTVLFPMRESDRELLAESFSEFEFSYSPDQISESEIIFGNPSIEECRNYPNLRWIQLGSAGSDQYVLPGVLPEGCLLTNATGAYGLTISEHMMGMLLMLYKNLHLFRDHQARGRFKWDRGEIGDVKTLLGATVLVIGTGNIGTEFAKRVKPFGCHVIGVRRTAHPLPAPYDETYTSEQLNEVLPKADIIAMALPNSEETTHIIDKEQIALMKDDAVIINVGRGSAIETNALCEALDAGKFWGIGLDVTEPEPLPEDHKLWLYPNVFITPHCSGGLALPETVDTIRSIFRENLSRYLKGEKLENSVDPETGYKETQI